MDTMSQRSKTISEYIVPDSMRNEDPGLPAKPFMNLMDTDCSNIGKSFYPDAEYDPYTL